MAACNLLRPEDVPVSYRDLVRPQDDNTSENGSCIIAPGGDVIATAPANEEMILTASISLEAVLQAKAVVDVGAHYSRPDVLQLRVNRNPIEPIVTRESDDLDPNM
jgi:predicted amidohydrolase